MKMGERRIVIFQIVFSKPKTNSEGTAEALPSTHAHKNKSILQQPRHSLN